MTALEIQCEQLQLVLNRGEVSVRRLKPKEPGAQLIVIFSQSWLVIQEAWPNRTVINTWAYPVTDVISLTTEVNK